MFKFLPHRIRFLFLPNSLEILLNAIGDIPRKKRKMAKKKVKKINCFIFETEIEISGNDGIM